MCFIEVCTEGRFRPFSSTAFRKGSVCLCLLSAIIHCSRLTTISTMNGPWRLANSATLMNKTVSSLSCWSSVLRGRNSMGVCNLPTEERRQVQQQINAIEGGVFAGWRQMRPSYATDAGQRSTAARVDGRWQIYSRFDCCITGLISYHDFIPRIRKNIYKNQKSICITSEAMQYRQTTCRSDYH